MNKRGRPSKNTVSIGDKFGRLIVKAIVHGSLIGKRKRNYVECLCECGNEKFIIPNDLASGRTQSCGCLQSEITRNRSLTHGQCKSRLYRTWCSIMSRCYNKNVHNYDNYGERGITVCNEWHIFLNFHKWAMENGYNDALTIDRINNNSGYNPDNCRWVGYKEQARNTRRNKNITIDGVTKCMSAWAEDLGIKPNILWKRIKNGQSDKYVITKLLYESSIITHPHT